MSASPKTALVEGAAAMASAPTSSRGPAPANPSAEALQALLAFSALHQQIRHRHHHETQPGMSSNAADAWHLEHFVLDEVLQLVAERALAITGADGVAIALAQGNAIVCRALAGKVTPDAGARLDPNSGFSGACLTSGEVVRCDDSEVDSRVDPAVCRALGTRSMVAVPLSAKQTIIGLVEAFSTGPYGFNDCDVRSLTLLAELILAALRPEEEDRLAEISQRVVADAGVTGNDSRHAEQDQTTEDVFERDHLHQLDLNVKEVENTLPLALEPDIAPQPEQTSTAPVAATLPGKTAWTKYLAQAVAALLTVAALVLGAGLWWNTHHHGKSLVLASPRTTSAPTKPASAPVQNTLAGDKATAESTESGPEESVDPLPSTTASGERPEVTGIRHWSAADSSTVAIDLQDQVQYEAHRLSHPERIYVDLHDTRLVASLFNKTIEVGDPLLERVRIAQPTQGVTRVVLETKSASNFSVSLEPNPYRLVIEVRAIGSEPKPRAKVELFAPGQAAPPLLTEDTKSEAHNSAALASEKLRIVLDAGHGGWDLGTVGRKGLLEKDLVLDIVERLGKLVEKRLAASVIYTRTDDSYIPLEKRAEIANLAKANLFVSVHANYSDFPSARGVETYYTNTYSSVRARTHDDDQDMPSGVDWTNVDIREKVHESRRLAASVQRALYSTLSAKNPGLPNRGVKEAQYVVLTGTAMPAVLAEVSFVSSPTDENNLQSSSYREQIAEALYQGVARYAEQNRVKLASAQRLVGQ